MIKPMQSALMLPLIAGLGAFSTPSHAMNDYPTLTRVEYVQECIQQYDRPRRELIYKCSCAIDSIAKQVDHNQWVALLTFSRAAPIAGERGAQLRERKDTRTKVKAYKEVLAKARGACFLPEPKEQ